MRMRGGGVMIATDALGGPEDQEIQGEEVPANWDEL